MAPRRAGAAPSGAPAPNPPAGVHSLPDDLLVHVLGLLSNEERCTAALVSRRWLTCAVAPELWLGFNLPIQTRHAQRLASFRRWLLRHGQHVRRVSIVLFPVGREQHDIATAAAAMPELVACCEALGAAAQQLEMFGLGWLLSAPLEVEAWAPQLPVSLHELALLSSSKLRITSSLGSLTQLTQLLLLGRTSMVLDAGVSLPPSVRMLALGGDGGELPSQLSALTGLGSLVLDKGAWLDEGAQMLTALSSLRSLEIREVEGNVPSGVLSKLTALEHLAVSVRYHVADEDELGMIDGNMAAILRHLTRLTSLYLKDALTAGAAAERRCLNGLTRLQQLYFEHAYSNEALPCGPWSSSLRALGASMECLEGSMPLLSACSALQDVGVLGSRRHYVPGPFWGWALHQALLRFLQLDGWAREEPEFAPAPSLAEAVATLQRARPLLEAVWGTSNPGPSFRYFSDRFMWFYPPWHACLCTRTGIITELGDLPR